MRPYQMRLVNINSIARSLHLRVKWGQRSRMIGMGYFVLLSNQCSSLLNLTEAAQPRVYDLPP